MKSMHGDLVTYRNEHGQVLFDLPDAPLPDPETPVPVRFLPGFDNILLSHKDRTRIISEERRRAIGSNNGMFQPTYLVDGFVAGTWSIQRTDDRATLILHPFDTHSPGTLRELEEEADRLLTFMTGTPNHEIRFEAQG